MRHSFTYLRRFWRYVSNSIAFRPALYVIGFTALAIGMRTLEEYGLSGWLGGEERRFFLVSDGDTARTILSTIIGGMISLTVFSFSMVMVVLSQATNTLSPRLLPQLIRDKSHQTVLGIYLGVIIFSYLTIIAIISDEDYRLPSFTVFIAVVLAIVCLGLFVYFISSISHRIQVDEVILTVHRKARWDMEKWSSDPGYFAERTPPHFLDSWVPLSATESGYVDLALYDELSNLAAEYSTEIYLCIPWGKYALKGVPLIKVKPGLSDGQSQELISAITLSEDNAREFRHLAAIRHITEVGVKAMSPGINDPGTALKSIDLLSDLMADLLHLPDHNFYHLPDGGPVYFAYEDFSSVLRYVMQELRRYSREDVVIMKSLTAFIFHLRIRAPRPTPEERALETELEALRSDAKQFLTNPVDYHYFTNNLDRLASEYVRAGSPEK